MESNPTDIQVTRGRRVKATLDRMMHFKKTRQSEGSGLSVGLFTSDCVKSRNHFRLKFAAMPSYLAASNIEYSSPAIQRTASRTAHWKETRFPRPILDESNACREIGLFQKKNFTKFRLDGGHGVRGARVIARQRSNHLRASTLPSR